MTLFQGNSRYFHSSIIIPHAGGLGMVLQLCASGHFVKWSNVKLQVEFFFDGSSVISLFYFPVKFVFCMCKWDIFIFLSVKHIVLQI